MCGIVALVGSREASQLLLESLKKLEYRGYDSAGLATLKFCDGPTKGVITCKKAKGKLINLKHLITADDPIGQVGIAHTRWATHGKAETKNAHPHLDSSGKVAVVQNGIIENHSFLRSKLEAKGIEFISETDTEVIPHLISEELARLKTINNEQGGALFRLAVQNVLDVLQGSYALAVIWTETPDILIVAKSKAPLLIGFGEGEFLCASDTPAFAGFTRTVLALEDKELALVTPLGVEIYDSEGQRQHRSPSLISGYESDADKGQFKHFMLKEIFEQPETAQSWITRYLPEGLPLESPVAFPFEDSFFDSVEKIQILACGTSRHAAMVGAYLLEQFAGVPTNVFFASEFRYAPPPLIPNVLTIGVTQSGETADTLAALLMEQERRSQCKKDEFASRQLGITNRGESSLARQLTNVIDIGAGLEVGVAATKTFLGQLLTFYGLAIMFAARREKRTSKEILELCTLLRGIPKQLREVIALHNELTEKLSHRFSLTKDVIFLGRGINYPIALEAALKLKEISYIHAEGYPAGEMKHGPIALLDQDVSVISIANKGIVFEKVISNAQEAKARDASLIGIAPEVPETKIFDHLLPIPEVSEWISPLLSVIPTQLLSYHIAARRGLDVDQPRNLAKSVTVE